MLITINDQMQMIRHQTEAVNIQSFVINAIAQRVDYCIFMIFSSKHINPTDDCQCQEIARVLFNGVLYALFHTAEYNEFTAGFQILRSLKY